MKPAPITSKFILGIFLVSPTLLFSQSLPPVADFFGASNSGSGQSLYYGNIYGQTVQRTFATTSGYIPLNDATVTISHNGVEICQETTGPITAPAGNFTGAYNCGFTPDMDGTDFLGFNFFRDGNDMAGVTPYDLVVISTHINGSQPFTSPYQFIAADVDPNGEVELQDRNIIQDLILGIITSFPDVDSWRFVPYGHLYFTPGFFSAWVSDPLNSSTLFPPYPSYLANYNVLTTPFWNDPDITAAGSAVGVKMGDVNFSNTEAFPFAPPSDDRTDRLLITSSDQEIKKGSTVSIQITGKCEQELLALLKDFGYDSKLLQFRYISTELLSGLTSDLYYVKADEGNGRVLWYSKDGKPVDLKTSSQLFTLHFNALENIPSGTILLNMSTNDQQSDFYTFNEAPAFVELEATISIDEISKLHIYPTVFNDRLTIQTNGGHNKISYRIFNQSGTQVASGELQDNPICEIQNLSNLPSGQYTIHLVEGNELETFQIIKN
jgi:hypothetical protein